MTPIHLHDTFSSLIEISAKVYFTIFQIGIQTALGLLLWRLIHSFTGGEWGESLRPTAVRAGRWLPLALVLFIPVALTLHEIFPWAQAEFQAQLRSHLPDDPHGFRRFCLSPLWFRVRAFCYLGLWSWMGRRLQPSAARVERSRLERGLMLVALLHTMSWAAMDWIMTLAPDWSSTGLGVMYIIVSLNLGLAVATLARFWARPASSPHVSLDLRVDLANLFLMSALLWIYMNFMQYLVIWSARQPKELSWYEVRSGGPWPVLIGAMVVMHFVLPFPILLIRSLKSRIPVLLTLSFLFLISECFENIVWVMP